MPPSRQLTVPWCAAYWLLTVFNAGVNMLCIGWCRAEFIAAVWLNKFARYAGVLIHTKFSQGKKWKTQSIKK